MTERTQVIFSEDAPAEECDFYEVDFYYPEYRSGESTPFACAPFTLNVTDGESITKTDEGGFRLYLNKGTVTVAPGWIYFTERSVRRPRPVVTPRPKPAAQPANVLPFKPKA